MRLVSCRPLTRMCATSELPFWIIHLVMDMFRLQHRLLAYLNPLLQLYKMKFRKNEMKNEQNPAFRRRKNAVDRSG